jgi:lipopolysaccharide/colanic/teichoic acid biosynthesis glycosyltransferase
MRRRWLHGLTAFGLVAIVAGSWLAYREVIGPARYGNGDTSSLAWWIGLSGLLIAAAYGLGLPELPRRRAEAAVRALGAVALSLAILSVCQLVVAQSLLPRSAILLITLITPIWSVLTWNLSADLRSWSEGRDRVMVITDRPDDVAALRADLDGREEIPASIVHVCSPCDLRRTASDTAPLERLVVETDPTVLVINRGAQNDDELIEQITRVHRDGVRVRTLALFYDGWLGKLPIAELAQVSLLFDIGEVHRTHYVRAKRVVDIAVGTIGSIVCALFVPLLAIGNLVANPGPLLFRQERIGKSGEPFTIYKFRTMTGDDTATWTVDDDDRITAFGRFLRQSHLDELPQMINILRGELSIVGPRPEQTAYVEELRTKIPFYDERHIVRPGLTGWAQVKQGYAATEGDALEKLQYDFHYLRRQSIAFDLRIVGRTVREIVGGLGR